MCSSLYFHKSIQRPSVSFTTNKNVSMHWQNALRFSQFPSTAFSRRQPLDVLYPYRALSLLIEDFCHSQISQERPDITTRRGLEPPTSAVTGRCSTLLSHRAVNDPPLKSLDNHPMILKWGFRKAGCPTLQGEHTPSIRHDSDYFNYPIPT